VKTERAGKAGTAFDDTVANRERCLVPSSTSNLPRLI
jgi:hypothetical protein